MDYCLFTWKMLQLVPHDSGAVIFPEHLSSSFNWPISLSSDLAVAANPGTLPRFQCLTSAMKPVPGTVHIWTFTDKLFCCCFFPCVKHSHHLRLLPLTLNGASVWEREYFPYLQQHLLYLPGLGVRNRSAFSVRSSWRWGRLSPPGCRGWGRWLPQSGWSRVLLGHRHCHSANAELWPVTAC